MRDFYEILEVPTNATQDKIKEQYRFLVQAWHPDKFPNPAQKEKAQEKLKVINEAYEVLGDTVKRAQYDLERKESDPSFGRDRSGRDRVWTEAEERRAEQEKRRREQAEEYRRRSEHERQQRQKAEAERRQAEQEQRQKEWEQEQKRRAEYERQQRARAEAAKRQANRKRVGYALLSVMLVVMASYWHSNYTRNSRDELVSGDLVTRNGLASGYSEFDVWVKNDSNSEKYVAFLVTGQYEDGTTTTTISNSSSPSMGHRIPARSTENYTVTFNFVSGDGSIEIIDCHIIVSSNPSVGYSYNEEKQIRKPCASQPVAEVAPPPAVVAAGERPQYALRYVQHEQDGTYVIREMSPPAFQWSRDIYSVSRGTISSARAYLSPDGSLILFSTEWNGIGVMDINGGAIRLVAEGENPTWAPGNRITYVVWKYGVTDICTIDMIGTTPTCISVQTKWSTCSTMAAQNPSGTKIAFTTGCNLFVMNPDGSEMHNVLLYSDAICDSPEYVVWSPDGTRLALLSKGYDYANLCVINADETGLRQLKGIAAVGVPAWSPDGKWLAYPGYPWGASLEIVSVDGTYHQKLIQSDYGVWFAPFWMPK